MCDRALVIIASLASIPVTLPPVPTRAASSGRSSPVWENSDRVAEALGEHVFDFFLRNKREEWADYRCQVTRFELDRSLPML